jgi:arylsulfatase A-like enzyme
MADLHQIFDGYGLGIRRTDEHIGRIIASLKKQGVYDNLVIIISADHGENFGELGIYAEHGTADQATTRVPLIIHWPGLTSGKSIQGLHYNLHPLPTLAEILSTQSYPTGNKLLSMSKKPEPRWDGQSFASTIAEKANMGRDYLVLSQCAHVCQRSVRFENWLYIRTYHDSYHLFPKEMLFDLDHDPHEQFNLASKYPDVCMDEIHGFTH